jgi:hypothetical protein
MTPVEDSDPAPAAENADGETATETMRRCAHGMLLRASQVSSAISEQILANVAGLAPNGSVQAVKALRDSTDQNVGAIFATLAFGVSADAADPPTGTQELLRHTVIERGDITTLLRAYRFGHALLWEMWSAWVADHVTEAAHLHEVLAISARHMFTYIDRSCERLVSDYYRDRPLGQSRHGLSAVEAVHELLRDEASIDESSASTVLQCDIGAYHVAMVLAPLRAGVDLWLAADALATESGASSKTALIAGDGMLWSWLTWPHQPSTDVFERLLGTAPREVVVGVGDTGRGRSGFASSHHQAREAARVARLNCHVRGAVVLHREVELAGVLCGDVNRARPFAADRLGALNNEGLTARRLRETLLVYLNNGCRRARAAEILHIHPKTVSYRLTQAEEILGRPLNEQVLDVGAALVIAQALDGAPSPPG